VAGTVEAAGGIEGGNDDARQGQPRVKKKGESNAPEEQ